jgi:hypothetical protein
MNDHHFGYKQKFLEKKNTSPTLDLICWISKNILIKWAPAQLYSCWLYVAKNQYKKLKVLKSSFFEILESQASTKSKNLRIIARFLCTAQAMFDFVTVAKFLHFVE